METATSPDLSSDRLVDALRKSVCPLPGAVNDYDPLLALLGNARIVLIGEATHGTHEFYRERAQITKRLIREKGFNAVAVEADWPDAFRVNRYVRGDSDDAEAIDALAGFKRFPSWLWRNADVLDFVGWLRNHNDTIKASARKTGFYGLDLYSLHASMAAVIAYLEVVDPERGALRSPPLRLLRPPWAGRPVLRVFRRSSPAACLREGGRLPVD